MDFRTKKKSSSGGNSLMNFIERYWLVLLGGIVAYPLLIRLMRMAEAKDKVNEIEAQQKENEAVMMIPAARKAALLEITTNEDYHTSAHLIAHHLGTLYKWYDPRSWTENDRDAFIAISESPCGLNIDDTLVECYYLFTGTNLLDDLQRVLDAEYFEQLKL